MVLRSHWFHRGTRSGLNWIGLDLLSVTDDEGDLPEGAPSLLDPHLHLHLNFYQCISSGHIDISSVYMVRISFNGIVWVLFIPISWPWFQQHASRSLLIILFFVNQSQWICHENLIMGRIQLCFNWSRVVGGLDPRPPAPAASFLSIESIENSLWL